MEQRKHVRHCGEFSMILRGEIWEVCKGRVLLSQHLTEEAATRSVLLTFYKAVDDSNRRLVGKD